MKKSMILPALTLINHLSSELNYLNANCANHYYKQCYLRVYITDAHTIEVLNSNSGLLIAPDFGGYKVFVIKNGQVTSKNYWF